MLKFILFLLSICSSLSLGYLDTSEHLNPVRGRYRSLDDDRYEITSHTSNGVVLGCLGEKKQDYDEILELFMEDETGAREAVPLQVGLQISSGKSRSILSEDISHKFWPDECVSQLTGLSNPHQYQYSYQSPATPRPPNVTPPNQGWQLPNWGACNCPPGIPGLDGPPGPNGVKGPPGANGKDGKNGLQGRPGRNGLKGPMGNPGSKGVRGPPGDAGREGRRGQSGDRGTVGQPGRKGLKGPKGSRGQPGKLGNNGTDGVNGRNGLDGPEGPQGLQGTPGTHGLPGSMGLPGRPGQSQNAPCVASGAGGKLQFSEKYGEKTTKPMSISKMHSKPNLVILKGSNK